LYDPFLRRHLAVAPFEAVRAVIAVLHEAPVASAFHLHFLDHELVAATPPLGHELRVGERLPYALT
jgi:hypothetical protein